MFAVETKLSGQSGVVWSSLVHENDAKNSQLHTTLSMGTQATMPPSHPSLSPHTHCRHCPICGNTSYVFFILFLTNFTETLFTPLAGSSNPHLFTMPRPSSLTSPTTAIASFAGT